MKLPTLPKLALFTAAALVGPSAQAQVLFQDDFETDSSANWTVKVGYYRGEAEDDFTVSWAYDYKDQNYNFFSDPVNFSELKVPPAPGGTGTKGVKLTVNKNNAEAGRFGINLYPKGKTFSGNYVLKFDAFMNHGSYYDTGGGTTEYTLAGINHVGDKVNWGAVLSGAVRPDFVANAEGGAKSDGIWFGYTAEGGAAQDFWTWEGTGDGPPKYLAGTSGGIPDRDNSGVADLGEFDGYNSTLFPSPPFEAPGVPGKRWVQVEVSQIGDVITWKLDGHVIAQRTNTSQWKSGTIMVGLCDPFPSIATLLDETWILIDNVRVEQVAAKTITVTTADNDSAPNDGQTSLSEALAQAAPYDTIKFNIPGAGPHTLVTPIGGYPLITAPGLTIDGYSQPGAKAATTGVLEGNNAQIKIILDSSGTDTAGDPAKPDSRSTRLPYPGYGDSENGVLAILGADNVTIRGLSFLGRHTPGSDEDPSIYSIALVNGANGARVQGNWFGVHPDGKTVKGNAAAVAAFRHRVSVNGANVDTFSERLIVGTDSDGVNDVGEGNVLCGHHITLALELPMNRVAGNYFNLLPDGKTFLKVDDIFQAQLDSGRPAGDSSVENYENGRSTDSTVIGTDGNGINDANERNIFNTVVYEHLIEFYSNARGAVIAGNYFGVATDGVTTPTQSVNSTPDLIEFPGTASLRLGSNGDGKSDDLEGNLIVKTGGGRILVASKSVLFSARRNTMIDNQFEAFPFASAGDRTYDQYYVDILQDPTAAVPSLTSYQNKVLAGKIASAIPESYPSNWVDIYVADAAADSRGVLIPGRWLATFVEGSDKDTDPSPGGFAFDLTDVNVPAGAKLVVAATYGRPDSGGSQSGLSVTGPLSDAVATGGSVATPINLAQPQRAGTRLTLTWTGGTAPFKVQKRASLTSGAWADLTTTSERTATVDVDGSAGYFRIQGTP